MLVHKSQEQLALIAPLALVSCMLGVSFGLVANTMINTQQAANQIFNFLLLPQLFLAGVFTPITSLPWYLELLSPLSPLRYVVDLFRAALYAGRPDYQKCALFTPATHRLVITLIFTV